MRLQRMLGHLSVLMQKKPDDVRDILVVACGAGVTAGSFVPYPNIKNITICDIEPLVPTTVTPKFSAVNYAITDGITVGNQEKDLGGKHVKVVFDDGRHYIRTLPPDAKFDVITSDPIDPWVKGCAALNTLEYYEMCKSHLKPGGVMSLWIPLYESNVDTAKSVIGTFLKVFPNGIVFSNDTPGGGGYDAVLFGTVDPPEIKLDEVQKLVDRDDYRPVKDSIMYVGFGTNTSPGAEGESGSSAVFDMFATYASGGKDLDPWIKDAQINTDQNLRLQYLAGMWLNADQATTIFQQILGCYRFPTQVFTGSPEKVLAMKQSLENLGRRDATAAPPASAPTTAPAR
jgi:spermidine synthase